jgi:ATP phosphoribosyltransferase
MKSVTIKDKNREILIQVIHHDGSYTVYKRADLADLVVDIVNEQDTKIYLSKEEGQ